MENQVFVHRKFPDFRRFWHGSGKLSELPDVFRPALLNAPGAVRTFMTCAPIAFHGERFRKSDAADNLHTVAIEK